MTLGKKKEKKTHGDTFIRAEKYCMITSNMGNGNEQLNSSYTNVYSLTLYTKSTSGCHKILFLYLTLGYFCNQQDLV